MKEVTGQQKMQRNREMQQTVPRPSLDPQEGEGKLKK
jgi:hypothetical protein